MRRIRQGYDWAICLLVVVLSMLCFSACDEDEIEAPRSLLKLEVESVHVRDATIRLRANLRCAVGNLSVNRSDGRTIAEWDVHLSVLDTLITDYFLRPHEAVSYRAYLADTAGVLIDSSNEVALVTEDTSSNAFTWRQFTLGQLGSTLSSVSVVNDSCIWVAGYIDDYAIGDSTHYQTYGAAEWDGQAWHLISVPLHDYGSSQKDPGELRAIQAFSSSDVYGVSDANVVHWNGSEWREIAFVMTGIPFVEQLRSLFVVSPHLVYCGGKNGSLFVIRDSAWTRVPGPIGLDCVDLYGSSSPLIESSEVYGICVDQSSGSGHQLLRIVDGVVTQLPDSGLTNTISSIWFDPGEVYFAVGYLVFSSVNPVERPIWVEDLSRSIPWAYPRAVRGNSSNDMVFGCANGDLYHFNGVSMLSAQGARISGGEYLRVDMKGNTVAAVGERSGHAIVTIGRR